MKKGKLADSLVAYKFVAPAILLMILFKLYPIVSSITGSFFQDNFLNPGQKSFVAFKNYINLLTDSEFYNSLWITIKLNLLINPIQIIIAFIMALIINKKSKGQQLYKILFYIPLGVSLAVATTYWAIILRPDDGVLNYILNSINLPRQPFYFSATQAIWVIILIASWKGCSFWMLFLHAGLQDIPVTVLEAADIEGANNVQKIFKITLPLMKRNLLFVLVADTSINFMLFIPVFMITKGGPDNSTNVILYEAFKSGIIQGDMGHALATITILLGILTIVIGMQFSILRDNGDY